MRVKPPLDQALGRLTRGRGEGSGATLRLNSRTRPRRSSGALSPLWSPSRAIPRCELARAESAWTAGARWIAHPEERTHYRED